MAAPVFGGISSVSTSSTPTSVSVSGSNTVGYVFVAGETTTDDISAVSWGGVSMTKIGAVQVPGDRWISAWWVANPSSSASIVFTGGTFWRSYSFYYRDAKQTGQPDSSNTGTSNNTTAITVATTVVAPGSVYVMCQKDNIGGETYTASGVLSSIRANSDAGGIAISDSNQAVGINSRSGTLTGTNGTAEHGAISFSIAPASITGAFLDSGDGGSTSGTSHSASVTIPTGTDLLVIIPSRWRTVAGTTEAPTSVTVNGLAATDTGLDPYGDQDIRWIGAYYYLTPPTGSQTIVASGGGIASDVTQFTWLAYTGMAQTAPNASFADVGETASTAYPVAVTAAKFQSWIVAAYATQGNAPTSYTSGVGRVSNVGGGTGGAVADSGAAVFSGAYTITQNQSNQWTSALSIAFSEAIPGTGLKIDNATATSGYSQSTGFTHSHLVTSTESDRAMAVFLEMGGASPDSLFTSIAVTYNGDSLTDIPGAAASIVNRKCAVFYMANPDTGANNVAVSWSGGGTEIRIFVVSFSGVNQQTPINGSDSSTDTGAGTSIATSLTTSVNGTILAGALFVREGGTGDVGASDFTLLTQDTTTGLGYTPTTGAAGSYSITWSVASGALGSGTVASMIALSPISPAVSFIVNHMRPAMFTPGRAR